jgi:DNA mismatch repair protein MutS
MALQKQYFELTQKYQYEYGERSIVLMQVGAFMEVYGKSDNNYLDDFSRVCDLNVVKRGESDVFMAGFKEVYVDKYVRKLQDAGYTIAVYAQRADDVTVRELAGIFSPGTYFPSESSEYQSQSNNIMCVWCDLIKNTILNKGTYIVVGIATIDIITGKTNVFQFKELYTDNPTNFDELERFVSIHNPCETIIISEAISGLIDADKIINYANINSKLIHRIQKNDQNKKVINCEKQPYQQEILKRFYKEVKVLDDYYDNNVATHALCYLLDFVHQHNPGLTANLKPPQFTNVGDKLVLANHSLKQLNIIDDHNSSGRNSSVLKMLNWCRTPMGHRQFAHELLNPITDSEKLEELYDEIERTGRSTNKENIYNCLSKVRDIDKFVRQIVLGKMSPFHIVQLYETICLAKEIANANATEKDSDTIVNLCDQIATFINSNIDISIIRDGDCDSECNYIRNGVNPSLDAKTLSLLTSKFKLEKIRYFLNGLIGNKEKSSKTTDFIKIHETEKNNYSLVCTSRRCKLLVDALPTSPFVRDLGNDIQLKISKTQFSFNTQSASNNTISDEQIDNLCDVITSVKIGLKSDILVAFNEFQIKLRDFQDTLEQISLFVSGVDVVYNKVFIAKKYNLVRPTLSGAKNEQNSFVEARDLRHCIIEQLQTGELYVTNDITLKNDGFLLYGTNAVGKTSLIRALGIAVIMAQAGLYVPCSSFIYKPYKYLFTRIVGNDNIFKGLSTFAVEMSELRTILRMADANSLILGDELCSGTENTSAASIFVAGIQKLQQTRSSFIFATHLHEIVKYEEVRDVTMKHLTVVYDREKDKLVYDRKLKDGPGDSMYGLEVCKSLNMPTDFLANAYAIRNKYFENNSVLSLRVSRYNSKKVVGVCELCVEIQGTEVHHIAHQKDADLDGKIVKDGLIFHKNNVANLLAVCEKCHKEIHSM